MLGQTNISPNISNSSSYNDNFPVGTILYSSTPYWENKPFGDNYVVCDGDRLPEDSELLSYGNNFEVTLNKDLGSIHSAGSSNDCLAFGNNTIVYGANNYLSVNSNFSSTWTSFNKGDTIRNVMFGNNTFMALCGYTTALISHDNGLTWSTFALNGSCDYSGFVGNYFYFSLYSSKTIYITVDGTNWSTISEEKIKEIFSFVSEDIIRYMNNIEIFFAKNKYYIKLYVDVDEVFYCSLTDLLDLTNPVPIFLEKDIDYLYYYIDSYYIICESNLFKTQDLSGSWEQLTNSEDTTISNANLSGGIFVYDYFIAPYSGNLVFIELTSTKNYFLLYLGGTLDLMSSLNILYYIKDNNQLILIDEEGETCYLVDLNSVKILPKISVPGAVAWVKYKM